MARRVLSGACTGVRATLHQRKVPVRVAQPQLDRRGVAGLQLAPGGDHALVIRRVQQQAGRPLCDRPRGLTRRSAGAAPAAGVSSRPKISRQLLHGVYVKPCSSNSKRQVCVARSATLSRWAACSAVETMFSYLLVRSRTPCCVFRQCSVYYIPIIV